MYTLLINIFVFSSVMQNDSTAPDSFGLLGTFFHAFVVLVDTLTLGKNRKEVRDVFLPKMSPFALT